MWGKVKFLGCKGGGILPVSLIGEVLGSEYIEGTASLTEC